MRIKHVGTGTVADASGWNMHGRSEILVVYQDGSMDSVSREGWVCACHNLPLGAGGEFNEIVVCQETEGLVLKSGKEVITALIRERDEALDALGRAMKTFRELAKDLVGSISAGLYLTGGYWRCAHCKGWASCSVEEFIHWWGCPIQRIRDKIENEPMEQEP